MIDDPRQQGNPDEEQMEQELNEDDAQANKGDRGEIEGSTDRNP